MIAYRGDFCADFEVSEFEMSRYGFPALFFSTDQEVAKLYAIHHAREKRTNTGYIYKFDLAAPFKEIDYAGKISYSSHFRNLMYDLFQKQYRSVLIRNCYDSPSSHLRRFIKSDLVIIFDFKQILNYQLLKSVPVDNGIF